MRPFVLHCGDVMTAYDGWSSPAVIVSDGAYGLGGFHGDPRTPDGLQDWYGPHIEAWSRRAQPWTTLWFWNSEIGWATVHPLLHAQGWEYVEAIIWDKGVAHVAGNVNGATIRQFPVVTEVCVFYRRRLTFSTPDGDELPAKQWMRYEWRRAGLPLSAANEACQTKNAATRKYLTQDWLWYFPPADAMEKMAAYANLHGAPEGRPYFSFDGRRPVCADEWARLRHVWRHKHALTNVWAYPPLSGQERLRGNLRRAAPRVYRPGKLATVHLNQKPLVFMERILAACTEPGDVVWEPFGGLCTASVAALRMDRRPYCAELDSEFAGLARKRLVDASRAEETEQPPLPGMRAIGA